MRVALGIIAGIVLVALAALALAPASLVDPLLAARTAGRVRLAEAGGVWWHGHGTLASTHDDARMPIAWRVAWLPLTVRALDVEFEPREPAMPRGHLRVAQDAIDARDLHATVPAALLPAFAPALEAVAPGGDIDVSTTSFAFHASRASGRIDVVWRDSRMAIVGIPVQLGRIVATATGTDDGTQGVFDNSGGELAIHGTWRARGDGLETSATLTPTASTPPALRTLLPMLGQVDAQGAVHVSWHGKR